MSPPNADDSTSTQQQLLRYFRFAPEASSVKQQWLTEIIQQWIDEYASSTFPACSVADELRERMQLRVVRCLTWCAIDHHPVIAESITSREGLANRLRELERRAGGRNTLVRECMLPELFSVDGDLARVEFWRDLRPDVRRAMDRALELKAHGRDVAAVLQSCLQSAADQSHLRSLREARDLEDDKREMVLDLAVDAFCQSFEQRYLTSQPGKPAAWSHYDGSCDPKSCFYFLLLAPDWLGDDQADHGWFTSVTRWIKTLRELLSRQTNSFAGELGNARGWRERESVLRHINVIRLAAERKRAEGIEIEIAPDVDQLELLWESTNSHRATDVKLTEACLLGSQEAASQFGQTLDDLVAFHVSHMGISDQSLLEDFQNDARSRYLLGSDRSRLTSYTGECELVTYFHHEFRSRLLRTLGRLGRESFSDTRDDESNTEAAAKPETEHVGQPMSIRHGLLGDWEEGLMSSTQTDQITKHLASCEPCLEELAPLIESGHLPLEGFETAVRSIEINSLRDRTIDPDEIAVPSGQISLSMWVLRVSTIAVSAVVIVIILSLVKPRRVAELDIARMEHALSQGKYEVALDEATQSLELVRRSDSRRRLIAIAEAASAAAANDALRDGDFERVREIRQLADRHGFLSAEMAVASYAAERGYSTTNLMRLLSRPDRDYGFSLDGTRQRRERESDELAQLIVLRERMESDLDRFPDSPVLLKNYGQLLLELDEPDSAGSVFEKYIADHDQDVDVSIGLGIVSLILGKQEIAESRFRIVAMDQGPNNVSARVGLAIALNQQDEQRSEEAYELLKGVQQVTRDADLKRNIEEFLGSAVDPQSALPGANSGVRGQFWGG